MSVLLTLLFASAFVAPSQAAAPLQGLVGAEHAVPFQTRSFGAVPVARQPAVPQVHSTVPWENRVLEDTRRTSSLLTARAEGIGAPGFPKDLAVCPGSNRATCNENGIHRVCVQLLEGTGPIVYGLDTSTPEGKLLDYWAITGKESFRSEWWKQMSDRKGDSRCIGMDSTSMLIEKVGCDKVNIRCDATDLNFVSLTVQPRTPGLKSLEPIKACVAEKCFKAALADAGVQTGFKLLRLLGVITAGSAAALAAIALRRRTAPVQAESLLG